MNDTTSHHAEGDQDDVRNAPEDRPDEPGAEGGSEGTEDANAPFSPDDSDDSEVGDTDQHSNA